MEPASSQENSLEAALRRDPAMEDLVRAHFLAEGSHFSILVCHTPAQAEAALKVLSEQLRAEGATVHEIERFRPSAEFRNVELGERERFKLLIRDILEPLYYAEPGAFKDRTVVIDASMALKEDHTPWNIFFQRMNEVRNGLTRTLDTPLILLLPPALEVEFALHAPDFWSIRSLQATLQQPPVVQVVEERPRIETGVRFNDTAEASRAPAPRDLIAKVEEARTRYKDNLDDRSAARALVILLDRLGEWEMEHGRLDAAQEAYEESLTVNLRLYEMKPNDLDVFRNFSVGLSKIGDVHSARGDLERALESYQKCLSISRTLHGVDPKHLEWLSDLSASLDRVGDVYRARGELDQALEAYQECLDIARTLRARDPERLEWLRALSISLDKVGDVHYARGDLGHAQETYQEGLNIRRMLRERDPERLEWLRDLSLSLDRVGDVHLAHGDLDRALEVFMESIDIRRTLRERDPERLEWLRDLTVGLYRIGEAHRARGDFGRALEVYMEGIDIGQQLNKHDPQRPEYLNDLGYSYAISGFIHEQQGDIRAAVEAVENAHNYFAQAAERSPQHVEYKRHLESSKKHLAHLKSLLARQPISTTDDPAL